MSSLPILGYALFFGIYAGFSASPLTTLVISESLTHGTRAGLKCSFAPIVTDPPIILLSWLLLTQLADSGLILGLISISGAVLLCGIAGKCFQVTAAQFEHPSGVASSLMKAVGVNFLNPNPYLAWGTVLTPKMLEAFDFSIGTGVGFLAVFYVVMLPIKMGLAIVAGSTRRHLNGTWLVWINRVIGLVMLAFALWITWSGCVMIEKWLDS